MFTLAGFIGDKLARVVLLLSWKRESLSVFESDASALVRLVFLPARDYFLFTIVMVDDFS